MQKKMISVVGGSDSDSGALRIAEEVGKEIAKRDAVLVCGGMGGVMEAACRGAKSNGGTTVGILPTDLKSSANSFVDIAIPTGMGYARNFMVAKASDAVIAIAGSAGTLSEIAIAWFSDIPIVAVEPTGGWAKKLAGEKLDHRRNDVVHSASNAVEAVEIVCRVLDW